MYRAILGSSIGLALTVLATASAFAEESDRGYWVQVGAGVALSTLDDDDVFRGFFDDGGSPVVHGPDPGFSIHVAVGKRLSRRLALVAAYDHFRSELPAEDEFDPSVDTELKLRIDAVTANLRVYAIPEARFNPYVTLGMGWARFDPAKNPVFEFDPLIEGGATSGFVGRTGLGVDFRVMERISIVVEATALLSTIDFDGFEDDYSTGHVITGHGSLAYHF